MKKIRFPAVAGEFYPEQKKELKNLITQLLKKAKAEKIEGNIFGLILPHAGYHFSGLVSAHAFKTILGKNFESVILIGDSHYERFDGVSIWEEGEWETPLGKIQVDEKLAKKILSQSERFFVQDSAHLFEHSLEVQLPFLQTVLKKFKIVPIIFGSENKDWKNLAHAILKAKQNKKVLILASSDLSHYPPDDLAQKLDRETIEAILDLDPEKFARKIQNLQKKYPNIETLACAQDSIKTIMEVAKNLKSKAKLLKYQTSAQSPFGDKLQVVGYCAIALFS